jgi:crossover junction endodeoxyribonuclease RuvC
VIGVGARSAGLVPVVARLDGSRIKLSTVQWTEDIRSEPQNAASVNVLGIDPGLANTGYGVVARRGMRFVALDGGVVTTRPGVPLEQRLATIYTEVCTLIERHQPEAVALEDLFFGQNAGSAFKVGQARGVVMLAAGQRGVPCASYTPQQVKQAVCGTGRAAKEQVARMVCAVLGLPDDPLPDHATDALAVGVCHANHAPLAAVMAAAR